MLSLLSFSVQFVFAIQLSGDRASLFFPLTSQSMHNNLQRFFGWVNILPFGYDLPSLGRILFHQVIQVVAYAFLNKFFRVRFQVGKHLLVAGKKCKPISGRDTQCSVLIAQCSMLSAHYRYVYVARIRDRAEDY